MASKKSTQKATKPRVKNAEFVIFDRTLQGAITVERIKTPLLENGLIEDQIMEQLKVHQGMRNREVQCVNNYAMSLWKPLKQSRNSVLTPPMVVRIFELTVEEGVEVPSLPFRLKDEFKVEITTDPIKNVLKGKTHKDVVVPRNLRAKYAAKVNANPTKMGKAGTPLEDRIAIILKVMGGTSGGNVAKEYDLTSSTVNTMVRQFLGRYRDGKPVSVESLPTWVPKARELMKKKIEEAGHNLNEFDPKLKQALETS